RPRHAVPADAVPPRRRAARGGRTLADRTQSNQAVQAIHHHPHRGRQHLLSGRGIPSGLLPQEPAALSLLPHVLRSRQAPAGALGQPALTVEEPSMQRRTFLGGLATLASAPLFATTPQAEAPAIEKLKRSEEEWKRLLTPEQF